MSTGIIVPELLWQLRRPQPGVKAQDCRITGCFLIHIIRVKLVCPVCSDFQFRMDTHGVLTLEMVFSR